MGIYAVLEVFVRTNWATAGLLLMLSACSTSPDVQNISGVWEDGQAAFTVCGETGSVAVELELAQTGSSLLGTFTLQGNRSAFAGKVEEGRITGGVRGDDGSGLDAALRLQEGRLTGVLTALEEISCTVGETSLAVYEVALTRR